MVFHYDLKLQFSNSDSYSWKSFLQLRICQLDSVMTNFEFQLVGMRSHQEKEHLGKSKKRLSRLSEQR